MQYQWERSQSFVATPHVSWINTHGGSGSGIFGETGNSSSRSIANTELLSKTVNYELLEGHQGGMLCFACSLKPPSQA